MATNETLAGLEPPTGKLVCILRKDTPAPDWLLEVIPTAPGGEPLRIYMMTDTHVMEYANNYYLIPSPLYSGAVFRSVGQPHGAVIRAATFPILSMSCVHCLLPPPPPKDAPLSPLEEWMKGRNA